MPKRLWVAMMLLLAACGRGHAERDSLRVHYLLDDSEVTTPRAGAVASPKAAPATVARHWPRRKETVANRQARQSDDEAETDAASAALLGIDENDQIAADNSAQLNYAILSGPVLGN